MDADEQVIIPIEKYNKMLNAYNKFNDELVKYEKEIESQYKKTELIIMLRLLDQQ